MIFSSNTIKADDLKKCIGLVKNCRDNLVDCSGQLEENNQALEENNETMEKLKEEKDSDVWQGRKEGCLFGGGLTTIIFIGLVIILLPIGL